MALFAAGLVVGSAHGYARADPAGVEARSALVLGWLEGLAARLG